MSISFQSLRGDILYNEYTRNWKQLSRKSTRKAFHKLSKKEQGVWNLLAFDIRDYYATSIQAFTDRLLKI